VTPRSGNAAGATPRTGVGTSPRAGKDGAKGGGQAAKDAQPPRRVQKNPSFLQQHRDRYGDHHRQLRGAKDDSRRQSGEAAGAAGAGARGGGGGGRGGDNRKKKFLHGNYDTYYSYRNPGAQDDPRIKVLQREWIEGKRVLDIGCNSGAITIEMARRMQPRHIMGVDIDASLINKARINLRAIAAKLHAAAAQGRDNTTGGAGQGALTEGDDARPAHAPADDADAAGGSGASEAGAAAARQAPDAPQDGKAAAGGKLVPPASLTAHRGVEVRKVALALARCLCCLCLVLPALACSCLLLPALAPPRKVWRCAAARPPAKCVGARLVLVARVSLLQQLPHGVRRLDALRAPPCITALPPCACAVSGAGD